MKLVEIIDPLHDERWDNFIMGHPLGALCHHSSWKEVIEKSFPHIHGHYLALIEDQNIIAGLPLYFVKSWITGKRLVSIPYATVCDPLVSTRDQMVELVDYAMKLKEDLKASRIEIRVTDSSPDLQDNRLCPVMFYKIHYLRLGAVPEILKKSFDRSCVVQKISRASKSQITMKVAKELDDVKKFYRLYSATRKRLGLPSQPYNYFENMWNILSSLGYIEVLLAIKDEQAIAGLLLYKFKKQVSAEYLGYDRNYLKINPHHFLFWQAIQSACHEGYEWFDFGRTDPMNQGLMDFKRHWGTTIKDLPQYYYPAEYAGKNLHSVNSLAQNIISRVCKNAPEFLLQTISKFTYRHLG